MLLSCCDFDRHMKEAKNAFDTEHALHTFSIGIQGSPDLVAARKVADFLGTEHHEFTFTVEEGIDALHDLIWHIESYEQVWACSVLHYWHQSDMVVSEECLHRLWPCIGLQVVFNTLALSVVLVASRRCTGPAA